MFKLIGLVLVLALAFGAGWAMRSYRNADACHGAGGAIDTNRGICVGVAASATTPLIAPPV